MIYVYIFVLFVCILLMLLSLQIKDSLTGKALFQRTAEYILRIIEKVLGKSKSKKYADRIMEMKFDEICPSIPASVQLKEFKRKKISLMFTVVLFGDIIAIFLYLNGISDKSLSDGNKVPRADYENSSTQISLIANVEGYEPKEMTVNVSSRTYSENEINAMHDKLAEELADIILSDNTTLDHVSTNLNLVNSVENYPFSISWESSNYAIVDGDGVVNNSELDNPLTVELDATVKYEKYVFYDIIYAFVYPAEYSFEEKLFMNLQALVEEENEKTKTEAFMSLPEEVSEKKIVWEEVASDSGDVFFLLLVVTVVVINIVKDKEVNNELENKKNQLLLDYPEIVNKITLYLGAGMTIRNAFYKMGDDYKKSKKKKKRYVYEEILLICNELKSGVSEIDAYNHLGKRCRLQCYLKLSTLLSQNLRKGSNNLLNMLKAEAEDAFTNRKGLARKLGEEAGTKLLLPMMMMLCIVMVIIMVPAFSSFSS